MSSPPESCNATSDKASSLDENENFYRNEALYQIGLFTLCCNAKTAAEVATEEIEVIQTLDLQRKRALMNDDTMLLPGDFGGKLEPFDSAAWCWEQSGPSGVQVTQDWTFGGCDSTAKVEVTLLAHIWALNQPDWRGRRLTQAPQRRGLAYIQDDWAGICSRVAIKGTADEVAACALSNLKL